jgi:hypothetical protein
MILLILAGTLDRAKMLAALNQIADNEPANQAGARFRRLMEASIKHRTHHAFVLAGKKKTHFSCHTYSFLCTCI